jgi:flavin reductase (DIM6/NTAB) family NADH-FMN oxidoreductase RutF
MAAIRPDSNVFKCLSESGVAVVHILDRGQTDLAQRFFSPTQSQSRHSFPPGRPRPKGGVS